MALFGSEVEVPAVTPEHVKLAKAYIKEWKKQPESKDMDQAVARNAAWAAVGDALVAIGCTSKGISKSLSYSSGRRQYERGSVAANLTSVGMAPCPLQRAERFLDAMGVRGVWQPAQMPSPAPRSTVAAGGFAAFAAAAQGFGNPSGGTPAPAAPPAPPAPVQAAPPAPATDTVSREEFDKLSDKLDALIAMMSSK